ncbi:PspC family transcriptional regulator [Weeksellaceae bacterium TAE3-ERU29]|nr:PspC family transcriptional regulator [Weeksellaceae bacterium TAE3-ERU29]
MLDNLRKTMEAHGFEVISRVADKLGLRASKLRLLFIYLSFATLGITFIFYLIMAFFLWVKDGFIKKRKSVFDL